MTFVINMLHTYLMGKNYLLLIILILVNLIKFPMVRRQLTLLLFVQCLNSLFEMYNNYFDSYVYGNLSGATMFLNQRGFGDVEINNSSTFQNDKIILNHNTTILSNLQVSGLFSCSSILDIAGSDARYVLQSDGLSGLITGNTNTINSILTNDSAQDTTISQKLDKVNTTAQTVNSPLILSFVCMKGNLFTNNDFSTDIKTKIDNTNTSINGLEPYLETYTPDAIEGFYIHHPNFVACSVGDITNASNQYFMVDGLVGKTILVNL